MFLADLTPSPPPALLYPRFIDIFLYSFFLYIIPFHSMIIIIPILTASFIVWKPKYQKYNKKF